jgi:Ca2+-binding RTX toxin-like protein
MATITLSSTLFDTDVSTLFDFSDINKIIPAIYDTTSTTSAGIWSYKNYVATAKNPIYSGVDGTRQSKGTLTATFDKNGNIATYSGLLTDENYTFFDSSITTKNSSKITSFSNPYVTTSGTISEIKYSNISGEKLQINGSIKGSGLGNIATKIGSSSLDGIINSVSKVVPSGNSIVINCSSNYKLSYSNLTISQSANFVKNNPITLSGNVTSVTLKLGQTSQVFASLSTNFSDLKNITTFDTALPFLFSGNDVITISSSDPLSGPVNGYTGNDKITASSLASNIFGDQGNDTLVGGNGSDALTGGVGNDSLTGGLGADNFVLAGNDTVVDYSGTQSDTIDVSGLAAGDTVTFTTVTGTLDLSSSTSTAAFKATAVAAGATITGSSGADILTGAGGIDYLFGGAGKDTLSGGAGKDVINGGDGNDSLTGGAGSDKFVFSVEASSTNIDSITDFAIKDDKIQLSKTVFTGFSAVGSITSTAFLSGAGKNTAATADQKLIYDSFNGKLYYDADGVGGTAAVQIALIGNKAALTSSSFEIIT